MLGAASTSGGFVGSIVTLSLGTAAGQAIIIAGSPILLRLYTPDEFGAFSVYLAVISIGAIVVTLRYEAAIPLPESEGEALDVLALAVLATVSISALVGLVAWLIAANVVVVTVPTTMRAMLWLLPLGLLLVGLQQTFTLWATRLTAFGTSARSSIAAGGAGTASQIALGVPATGVIGLVLGYLFGRLGGIIVLIRTIGSSRRAALRGTSTSRLRAVAARHRRFPLYALWAALLNTASVQAPVLLLAAMFDTTVVGWFSITVRVLQLPSTLVGSAVAQVFYARISREDRSDVAATTRVVYGSLVALGAGPMVLLAVGGQQLFALVFGEAWAEAGTYAQWLAPWLLLVFVTSPLSTLVFVRERQRTDLVFQALLLGMRTATLVAGAALGSATLAIVMFGVVSAVLWGGYMLWLLRIGGVGVQQPLWWLTRNVMVALLLSTPLLALSLAGVRGFVWAILGMATLGVLLLRARREIGALRHRD